MPFDALDGATDGLIALTAGGEGALARLFADGQADKAGTYAGRLKALFPDRLYIELSRRGDRDRGSGGRPADRSRLRARPAAWSRPTRRNMPSRNSMPRMTRCCASPPRPMSKTTSGRELVAEAWLKPAAAMEQLFADLPEAIANTAVIAQRCAVAAPKRRPILPRLSATTRTKRCAARRMPGWRSGWKASPKTRSRSIANGSISRSTSSPAWGSPATS